MNPEHDNDPSDPVVDRKSLGNTDIDSLSRPVYDLDWNLGDENNDTPTDDISSRGCTDQYELPIYNNQATTQSEAFAGVVSNVSNNTNKLSHKKRDKKLNRWPRAFARILDLAWEMILALGLVGYFVDHAWINSGFGSPVFYLLLFVSLPVALLLDAIVAGLFGNTPVKAIVGVKAVSARGERLGLQKHIRRNIGVWTDGLGMGVLPMSFFTLTKQFKRVSGRREALYDEQLHVRSHSSDYAASRLTLLILAVLCSVAGILIYTDQTLKDTATGEASQQGIVNEQIAANVQKGSIVEKIKEPESAFTNSNENTSAVAIESKTNKSVESTIVAPGSIENETQIAQVNNRASQTWTNPLSNLQSEIPLRFSNISYTDAVAIFRDLPTGTEVILEKINNASNGVGKQVPSELIKNKFNHIEFDNQIASFPLSGWSIHEMQGRDSTTGARANAQISETSGRSNETYLVLSTTNALDKKILNDIDRLKATIWNTLPTP